jgi:hypothetical protein
MRGCHGRYMTTQGFTPSDMGHQAWVKTMGGRPINNYTRADPETLIEVRSSSTRHIHVQIPKRLLKYALRPHGTLMNYRQFVFFIFYSLRKR